VTTTVSTVPVSWLAIWAKAEALKSKTALAVPASKRERDIWNIPQLAFAARVAQAKPE
jgi:hypothetical protein